MIRGLSKTLTRETGSRENVSLLDTRDFDEGTISYRIPEPEEKFVLLLDTRDIGSECCLIFGHQRHWIRGFFCTKTLKRRDKLIAIMKINKTN